MKRFGLQHGYFTTNDGVRLHYLEQGQGQPIILLAGFLQQAQIFSYQLSSLSHHYHVIALDLRGHGLSQKVNYGFRFSRFSKDLHELIEHLHLSDIILIGHSLGVGVIWTYLELFGDDRITKLIFTGFAAAGLCNPIWTSQQIRNYGPLTSHNSYMGIVNSFMQGEGDTYTRVIVNKVLSKRSNGLTKQRFTQSSSQVDRAQAAKIMYQLSTSDWIDFIPLITLPTLIIAGRAGLISYDSQVWLAEQIPNATLITFEEDKGGKHYIFFENPTTFNKMVNDFIYH